MGNVSGRLGDHEDEDGQQDQDVDPLDHVNPANPSDDGGDVTTRIELAADAPALWAEVSDADDERDDEETKGDVDPHRAERPPLHDHRDRRAYEEERRDRIHAGTGVGDCGPHPGVVRVAVPPTHRDDRLGEDRTAEPDDGTEDVEEEQHVVHGTSFDIGSIGHATDRGGERWDGPRSRAVAVGRMAEPDRETAVDRRSRWGGGSGCCG